MSCTTVTTQTALDSALADDTATCVHIESPDGVWLELRDNRRKAIQVQGSSRVVARDSSRVVARDSSRVVARGSSSVVARDSSSVEAWDSSSVEAWDSSRVEARGSSRVEARESSRVVAWGAATVHAHQGTITAGPTTAVFLHSGQASITGGVLIDLTQLDLYDAATWCDHNGVKVVDGRAVLYKAVDQELTAGRSYIPTTYAIGSEVEAGDWLDDHNCGRGLHLSPTPGGAAAYSSADPMRFLRCTVALEDLRPIGDKAKARACRVEVEVDRFGDDLPGGAS